MQIQTLQLPRAEHALADLHKGVLPPAALIIFVRYSLKNMFVIYRP